MRMLLDNRRKVRVFEKMRDWTYLSVRGFTSDYYRVWGVEAAIL
jgi:hypothetical protein